MVGMKNSEQLLKKARKEEAGKKNEKMQRANQNPGGIQ